MRYFPKEKCQKRSLSHGWNVVFCRSMWTYNCKHEQTQGAECCNIQNYFHICKMSCKITSIGVDEDALRWSGHGCQAALKKIVDPLRQYGVETFPGASLIHWLSVAPVSVVHHHHDVVSVWLSGWNVTLGGSCSGIEYQMCSVPVAPRVNTKHHPKLEQVCVCSVQGVTVCLEFVFSFL